MKNLYSMENSYKPLISVVVPVYNVAEYLDECVTSLVKQTYRNLEIILVDDGSLDNCPRMCDDWAGRDSRVRVIHKKNGGLSDARNAGVAAARGEYVGFVDSDDFVDERMYEKLIEPFYEFDDIVVSSIRTVLYKNGKLSPFPVKEPVDKVSLVRGADFAERTITQKSMWSVWNKLYERTLIEGIPFRYGKKNEDTLFMFDLGRRMKSGGENMVELPYDAYFYRIREGSICTNSERPLCMDYIENLETMMGECGDDRELKNAIYGEYCLELPEYVEMLRIHKKWKECYTVLLEKFRRIPLSVYRHKYGAKYAFWIFMQKYFPNIKNAYFAGKRSLVRILKR